MSKISFLVIFTVIICEAVGNYPPPPRPQGPGHHRPGSEYQRPGSDYQRPGSDYQRPASDYQRPASDYQRPGYDYQQSGSNYQRPNYGGRPNQGGRPQGNIVFQGDGQQSNNPMQTLFSWRVVDYTFDNDATRDNMIRDQTFIPLNNLILDVDVYGRTIFVTVPRARPGVPVTLATVTSRRRGDVTLLAPFPDWRSHLAPACEDRITSVFRTHVDKCGRLWVLDSGNNNVFAGNISRIVCPPQVIIYDLNNNNRLIGKFPIPSTMVADNSLFVTIAVDTRNQNCNDAYAYIADSIAYKMIVFNLRSREFWRINSILFFPYPDYSRFDVSGVSFDLMGGVFGLAIGPVFRGQRRLYFHCIDSVKQSWSDTADLRDQSLWRDNMNAKPRAFNLFNGTRSSQSAAATMNDEGIMFFGLIGSNEIGCWDSRKRFSQRNLVSIAKDNVALQFNSGIKVYGDKLYVVTSRLQNYLTNQVREDEVNYRVLVGDVRAMTRGTRCEVDGSNRFDSDYEPDSESVDHPRHSESFF